MFTPRTGREPLKPAERGRLEEAYFDMRKRANPHGMELTDNVGERSAITPDVMIEARRLSKGKDARRAAQELANFVHRTKMVPVSPRVLQRFYNAQTAHDVVLKRVVPTLTNKNEHWGQSEPLVGCQTLASTMAALLRATEHLSREDPNIIKGKISDVKVVRTISEWSRDPKTGNVLGMPHTIVQFKIDGGEHYADPFGEGKFLGGRLVAAQGDLKPDIVGRIAQLKKQGDWREAHDVTAFGTNTFREFLDECHSKGADIAKNFDLADFTIK